MVGVVWLEADWITSDWVHDKFEDDRDGMFFAVLFSISLFLTFILGRPSRGARRSRVPTSPDRYEMRQLRLLGFPLARNTDEIAEVPP